MSRICLETAHNLNIIPYNPSGSAYADPPPFTQGRQGAKVLNRRRMSKFCCHCEERQRRGNPFSLCIGAVFMCGVRRMRIATTGVRTGLATAAYLDSLICRLVPLGAMTGGFGRVSRFVMRCRARWLRDGTGAVPYGRVLGTCFLFSPAPVSTLATLSGSDSRQKFHFTAGRRARRA